MKIFRRWGIGVLSMLAFALPAGEVDLDFQGGIRISEPECALTLALWPYQWKGRFDAKVASVLPQKDGSYPFTLAAEKEGDGSVKGALRMSEASNGTLEVAYQINVLRDLKVSLLGTETCLAGEKFFGGTAVCDGRTIALPKTKKDGGIFSGALAKLSLTSADGKESISFAFAKPVGVTMQDNRHWGSSNLVVRFAAGNGNTFKAGEKLSIVFTLAAQSSIELVNKELVVKAGKDWIPLTVEPDIAAGSALDFSSLIGIDGPAGKYGRLVAKGPHFEFEKKPGVPQRFYGVNLAFTACYCQSLEEARVFVKRFTRIGYNAIRLHHYDSILTQGSPDGTTINPKRQAELDNLMAACAECGVYVTADLCIMRNVPWRTVGIDRDGIIEQQEWKALVAVHEGAFQNFQQFIRSLLTHVNPHTGRRYADEPALAWLAILNEGNPGNGVEFYQEMPEWSAAWKEWLAERKGRDSAFADVPDKIPDNLYANQKSVTAFDIFLQENEQRFATRIRSLLRDELKCQALITDMSAWHNPVCFQLPRERCYDYVDDHFYVDHPRFIEHAWRLPAHFANENPIRNGAAGVPSVIFRRALDKPFTVTEFNYAAPNRFRGAGGLITGSLSALQDWDGLWRFAWSHDRGRAQHIDLTDLTYLEVDGDPFTLAEERAFACLFLRRDLAPLSHTYALVLPEKRLTEPLDKPIFNDAPWKWVGWHAKIGTSLGDVAPRAATWSGLYPKVYEQSADEIRRQVTSKAGDGAVAVDATEGTFVVATPRTCGGFAETGVIAAGGLKAAIGATATTLWVSSLDNEPIASSRRLLMTHLTDLQMDGISYVNRRKNVLLAWGKLPLLVQTGKADVSLALRSSARFAVYRLSTGGVRRGKVPCTFENGVLSFTADVAADPACATFLYEIVAE